MRARLYLVADARPLDFLRRALEGGVDAIQLRDKSLDDDGILRAALPYRAAASEFGVPFILNDRPDLVERVSADGVHLGQEDAGERAGDILGRSTHAPEQAQAVTDADYISIGPVWETPTKPGRPAAGLDYVSWAAENVERPWFAIGNLVGFAAGLEVRGEDPKPAGVIGFSALMLIAAVFMVRRSYWAVLGFQALLALVCIVAALSLMVASNLYAAALCLGLILGAGTLFWFLIRAMARIQMPERPNSLNRHG